MELADRLAKSPNLLSPACCAKDRCKSCVFAPLGEKLAKIAAFADDRGKLESAAKWTMDPFARAYAGFLLLRHSEQNIYLLVASFPGGSVSYAFKGRAPKEMMIGVQHFSEPKWRLLAYSDYAKRGFHLYSGRDRMHCSGKDAAPPAQFVKDALSRAKYPLKGQGSDYACPHVAQSGDATHLKLRWRSAGATVSICEKCASADQNVYCKIAETILSKDPREDFEVSAAFSLACGKECKSCAFEGVGLDPDLSERYLSGQLSDKSLLGKFAADVQAHIEHTGRRLFVASERCFGPDSKEFIDSMNPDPDERRALVALLDGIDEPVFVDQPTPGKVLALLWKTRGKKALEAVLGDATLAERVYTEAEGESPLQALKDAVAENRERQVLAGLPKYGDRLPPVARLADRAARAFRTGGPKDAAASLEKAEKKTMKEKAVAYGFLMALGMEHGKEWQYAKDEKEFAVFLKDYARALLDADAQGYNDALSALQSASGTEGEVKPLHTPA